MAQQIKLESNVPKFLDYSNIKNVGLPSNIKQMRFQPQNSQNGFNNNDIIRFLINLPQGFWDPKSAYIEFTVDTSDMDSVGLQQIDNSASSFFSEFTINVNQNEIERIQEYDVVTGIVNDIQAGDDSRQYRRGEGFGKMKAIAQNTSVSRMDLKSSQYTNGVANQENQRLMRDAYNPILNYDTWGNKIYDVTDITSYQNLIPSYPVRDAIAQAGALASANINGIFQRADYNFISFLDTGSVPDRAENGSLAAIFNTTAQDGFRDPFPELTSAGSFESHFTKQGSSNANLFTGGISVITNRVQNTFIVPWYSGVLGHLMPDESYKYIPMRALKDLLIEFRTNPYAMFTSGYTNDTGNSTGDLFLQKAPNVEQQRKYKITKIELLVDIVFFDNAIEQQIQNLLDNEGILLHTNSYYLGPIYSLINNAQASGSFQVNLGFDSLKAIIIAYLSSDYLKHSFCRKQYRLSRNLTDLQLRIGSSYYPPQPIKGFLKGKGGNSVGQQENNAEFLKHLFCIWGCDKRMKMDSIINSVNFAINQRPYNIDNNVAMFDGLNFQNMDTAGGMPIVHENRYVGKSLYGISLETLNNDESLISGINTINNRPIEINVKNEQGGITQDTNSQMMIFCFYDMMVNFTKNGAEVFGRA